MKKIIIIVLACLPLAALAQSNVWEIPDNAKENTEKTVKEKKEKVIKKKMQNILLALCLQSTDGWYSHSIKMYRG